MRGVVVMAALLVAGCAHGDAPPGAMGAGAGAGEGGGGGGAITLATGPCFGTCPVYTVTVRPDGTGTFEGQRFTAVTGTRAFRVAPRVYRRLATMLAPWRPAEGTVSYRDNPALCGDEIVTDLPSTDVIWHGTTERRLNFYFGCGMQRNAKLRDTLKAAPGMLPIAELIRGR